MCMSVLFVFYIHRSMFTMMSKLDIFLSLLHFTPDGEYDTVPTIVFLLRRRRLRAIRLPNLSLSLCVCIVRSIHTFGKIVNSCVCSNSHPDSLMNNCFLFGFIMLEAASARCVFISVRTRLENVRTRTKSQVIFNMCAQN